MSFQPFAITEFKTGKFQYLQPWIRPVEAFEPLENAYIYRGALNKRGGYIPLAPQLPPMQPVMGIMQRINESTGAASLVVADTKQAYLYNGSTFVLLSAIANSTFFKGTVVSAATPYPTFWQNLVPGSVHITDGTTTIVDNGTGGFTGIGGNFASATIVYSTGVVTLGFTGTPTISLTITVASTSGNYFTGNNTQFFNFVNWQPTDPQTFVSSISYLYFTNNNDPITLFDGTNLSRPIFYIDSVDTTKYVTTTLDVKVYENRLLFVLPKVNTFSNPVNQGIFYSAIYNPTNFIQDVVGNGGQLTAATGDIIQSAEFLRNILLVFFTNSTWVFRSTSVTSNPFVFTKLNDSKNTNAPYASVPYDQRCTSIGFKGLIACDGTNVQRYDIPIIDFFENEIQLKYFNQCFSQRYDSTNQSWMLYVSRDTVPAVSVGADKALIYNFLENTWATFKFAVPMSCLGTFTTSSDLEWEDITQTWESADFPWNYYLIQSLAPSLLAGDQTGNIYIMNIGNTDNGTDIDANITSAKWNPFVQAGQKVQFGYIDFYYLVTSQDATDPTQLELTFFYDNNNADESIQRILTLDGPVGSQYAWKRIFINVIGEFLQMNIDPDQAEGFQILGMILWAKPAGRLTPS